MRRRQYFKNMGLDEFDSDDYWSSNEDFYSDDDGDMTKKPLLEERKKKRRKQVQKTRSGNSDDVIEAPDLTENKESDV